MIDHVVLLALREGVTEAELARFGEMLAALPSQIEGITFVRSGPSTSSEGLEHGYAFGFVVGFVDAAARDAYLPHPAHAPVAAMAQQLSERVLVFDIAS